MKASECANGHGLSEDAFVTKDAYEITSSTICQAGRDKNETKGSDS
jgi:hypothetical protein